MTCPSCGGELLTGTERCPVCDAGPAPRVEGALAADPRLVTPPARPKGRVEPLREIPGLRRRERTWRDEVQERVRSRRQKRAAAGLPLFDEPKASEAAAPPEAEAPLPAPAPDEPSSEPPAEPEGSAVGFAPAAREPDLVSTRLSEAELADLPLRPPDAEADEEPASRPETAAVRVTRRPVPSLDDDVLLGEPDREAELELAPPVAEPAPLERPARPAERAQAAAADLLLFGVLAALVLYFTGRAARADLGGLAAGWPGLAGYLTLLALFYAGYFTGTTGQTPGKMMTGLRVVGATGRPPGYGRAMARAFLGLLGAGLLGLGLLPMAFDPAVRALHDRLFRTRVVHG